MHMHAGFADQLQQMAEVIVRVGLNLQPGQPLLITDPYDLQGVHPEAVPLVEAVRRRAGDPVTTLTASPAAIRTLLEEENLAACEALVVRHTRRMRDHLAAGGAFLFLTGSEPGLLAGLPADLLARFDRLKWKHLGPVIQRLIRGAAQWTLVPSPTCAWAGCSFSELPPDDRLPALWRTVITALRADEANPADSWHTHLAGLARQRDQLNAARHRRLRYTGPGTDLTLDLPRSHAWCTAQLVTNQGIPFVVNLPTEEVFTAPHQHSARGTVRVARPVVQSGTVMEGIELEFRGGLVVAARAEKGTAHLQRLLATDAGAARLGEVAIVPGPARPVWGGRCLHHTLLDENAGPHIALGDAYRFCSRAWWPRALNASQLHLDLPLDATVGFD